MKLLWNRFFHKVTWLLIASMVFTFQCAGIAGAEEQTIMTDESANSNFAILENLLNNLKQNPPEDCTLADPDGTDEYCLKLYGYIDPDCVQRVFYDGPEAAAELLKNISTSLFPGEGYTDTGLYIAEYYYVYVWSILHADISDNYKARPAVNEIMKQEFGVEASEIFAAATDICFDYIHLNEPDLAMDGYNMNTVQTTINGSDEYIQAYQEGARLFDEGNYTEAIEAYTRCLAEDEKETNAHFEIAEAYIALRDFDQAKEWLKKVIQNISEDKDKARLLRRFGFIAIEELNYEAANAFYTYSLQFEESDPARQELAYIQYLMPDIKEFTAADAMQYIATEYGIAFGE